MASTGLQGQTSASGALARAEAMHEALQRKPVNERRPEEYRRIAAMMSAIWQRDSGSNSGQQAEYEAGTVYVGLARDQHDRAAWQSARECFETLLKGAPYSAYRRNAEWALAQIELNHAGQSHAAQHWLEDFAHRYPADPRVEIAHQQLRGERVSDAPILGQRESGPPPLPLAPAEPTPQNSERQQRSAHSPSVRAESTHSQRAGRHEPVSRTRTTAVAQSLADLHEARVHEIVFGRAGSSASSRLNQILGLRVKTEAEKTSVVLDLTRPVHVVHGYLPETHRYYFDLHDSEMGSLVQSNVVQKMTVSDGRVLEVHIGQNRSGIIRLVIDTASGQIHADDGTTLSGPPRFEVNIGGGANSHREPAVETLPPGLSLARNSAPQSPLHTATHTATSTHGESDSSGARAVHTNVALAAERSPDTGRQNTTTATKTASGTQTRDDAGPEITIVRNTPPAPVPTPATHTVTPAGTAGEAGPSTSARNRGAGSTVASSSTSSRGMAPAPPADADGARSTSASNGSLYTASGDPPTQDGSRSLTRVLGLKIHKIVLDAGHGGHDTGTIGPGNLYEKDVVLDVTRRLGRLLQDRLGMDVIYTRKTDVFIPLQDRTAIANAANADLFLSIHANSSDDASVRGIETYYLDFTHNPRALAVAARENATSQLSAHSLQTLIQRIALNDKQQESREFAGDLLTNLVRTTRVEDRGVKSAPFVVLIGARMPSVLAEISFLSDPADAHLLRESSYRERIAEALYHGVARYLDSLNGVRELKPHSSEQMAERTRTSMSRGDTPRIRPVSDETH